VGQKVHPYGFRVGIRYPWLSNWTSSKREFGKFLVEDYNIRDYVKQRLRHAGISKIVIERTPDEVRLLIHAARPAIIVMSRRGQDRDQVRDEITRMTGSKVVIDVAEARNREIDAQLVAEGIAEQLARRASFRRAMRRAVEAALQNGALGIKIRLAGRLGGAEMSRREKYVIGSLPLHTIDAEIDYGVAEAKTIYGIIGVKVWIYRGAIKKESAQDGVNAQAL
jgi:small subunit ribosomal protein S3